MKIDISVDCTYSRCAAKQLIENADAMELFRYMLHLQLLGKLYKDDEQSYDIACEIAECIGFNKFLKRKHTYEELVEYYNDNCCEDSDEGISIPQETAKKPLLDVDIACDYKLTDETKQMKETIMTTNEKRAALLKKKPNVK